MRKRVPPLGFSGRPIDPDRFHLFLSPVKVMGVSMAFDVVQGEDNPLLEYGEDASQIKDRDAFHAALEDYAAAERARERAWATGPNLPTDREFPFAKGTGRVAPPSGAKAWLGGSESDVIAFIAPVNVPADPVAPVTWRVVRAYTTQHDGPRVYIAAPTPERLLNSLRIMAYTAYLSAPGLTGIAREAFGMGRQHA